MKVRKLDNDGMADDVAAGIADVLISPEAIQKRVAEMGGEVGAAFRGVLPLLVGVLKGCALFMSDLVRHIGIPLEMDFICLTGYGGAGRPSGAARITKDLDSAISGYVHCWTSPPAGSSTFLSHSGVSRSPTGSSSATGSIFDSSTATCLISGS